MFESYLSPAHGIAPHRDLASYELWAISLERSLRRRELAATHRRSAPKTKGAAAAVSAALLVTPLLPTAFASAASRGATPSSAVQPLKRQFTGRVLQRGSTGSTVAQVQRVLGVAADGIFGPVTAGALRDFQTRNRLPRTGKVDSATWLALLKAAVSTPVDATTTTPATTPAAPGTCGGLIAAPLHGTVTSPFGDGRNHPGIDLAAPIGTAVRAAACGTVTFAGTESGYGKYICVQHSSTFSTCYAHLSVIGVAKGAFVAAGQMIGRVGMTGNTTGPHLHFETRVSGTPENPAPYLAGTTAIPGVPLTSPAAPATPAAPGVAAPVAAKTTKASSAAKASTRSASKTSPAKASHATAHPAAKAPAAASATGGAYAPVAAR
ncbi:MAG TPA: peptidoglycan DD-metalloendopeptidase family protein [Solirubrobacteraceae bacterium]|nr:peptidoglycan DD-metalloendopeptidase family protein [Solirubrobacteraceae bacterium]